MATTDDIDILLFDLDGTLYRQDCGYEDEVHANIFRFMVEMKGGKFDEIQTIDEAKAAWKPVFSKYNLTKRGLLGEGYQFDSLEYDRYVRRGAEKYIKRDPDLRSFLESLPQKRKVIFTNAPESSANEILTLLGVADLFEAVLGTDFLMNQVCKPERRAFDMVLAYLDIPPSDHNRVCYFEDSYKNLIAGKELGFWTVFITSETLKNEGRSYSELSVFDAVLDEGKVSMSLKKQLPQLWD